MTTPPEGRHPVEGEAFTPTGPTPDGPNLTRRTLTGFSWTFAATLAGLVAQLAYTSVINRLLPPDTFGLVASAQAVLIGGQFLSELGVGRAVVQKTHLDVADQRTAFTSSLLLGAALTGGLVLAAPLVGVLFDEPDVVGVTRGLALLLLANAIGITATSVLRRELRFKAVALLDLGSFAVGYLVIGIGAAVAGFGVWSLVAAAVSKAAIEGVGSLVLARHPMRPLLARRSLAEMYAFGSQVSIVGAVEYVSGQLPVAAVGRLRGQAALGQFSRAAYLVDLPFIQISNALTDVLFPAVARIKAERVRVRVAYMTSLRVTAALLLPTAAGAAVASDELVAVVLGDQWERAAAVLPLLAAHATLMMLVHYAAIVCEALAVLWQKLVIQVATFAVLAAGFVVVRDDGLEAFAVVMVIAQVVRLIGYWALMARQLGLPAASQPAALLAPAVTAALTAGAIAGWTAVGGRLGLPTALVLMLQIVVGGAVLAWGFWYGPLRRIRDELVERLELADAGGGRTMRTVLAVLRVGRAEPQI